MKAKLIKPLWPLFAGAEVEVGDELTEKEKMKNGLSWKKRYYWTTGFMGNPSRTWHLASSLEFEK